MDPKDRLNKVETGLNSLHDHFDQLRAKHKQRGNKEAEEGAKEIQSKLEEVESRSNNKDFAGALSGLESLQSISHRLERHDDSFEWYNDPVIDEWLVEMKTELTILDELEYKN